MSVTWGELRTQLRRTLLKDETPNDDGEYRWGSDPDLREVEALGFACPQRGGASKDCVRLDWFELVSGSAKRQPGAILPR